MNVFPHSTLAGLQSCILIQEERYGFWAAKIRLLGCKNTTFMTKVIGFWFLFPWFLVSISLVFGFYLPGFWFLSHVLIPINVIMTSFNVFQMPILMLLNLHLWLISWSEEHTIVCCYSTYCIEYLIVNAFWGAHAGVTDNDRFFLN